MGRYELINLELIRGIPTNVPFKQINGGNLRGQRVPEQPK